MTYPHALARNTVRSYDQRAIELGVPGPVLMENAARGCMEFLLSLGVSGPIGIVCGKGNNAGDGFCIARQLKSLGCDVAVHLLPSADELSGDAATAFKPLGALSIAVHPCDEKLKSRLARCEWIVDALLGTGAKGEVRRDYAECIHAMNGLSRLVLAVDLPSGLDCDSGTPLGAGPVVVADVTATFVARKRGFDHPTSRQYTGRVHVVDLRAGTLTDSSKPS